MPLLPPLKYLSALKTCFSNFTVLLSIRLLSFYRIILLVQAYRIYFVNKVFLQIIIIYMLVYRLFLSFLFINKCLPVNKLAQITPKLTSSCSSTNYLSIL